MSIIEVIWITKKLAKNSRAWSNNQENDPHSNDELINHKVCNLNESFFGPLEIFSLYDLEIRLVRYADPLYITVGECSCLMHSWSDTRI